MTEPAAAPEQPGDSPKAASESTEPVGGGNGNEQPDSEGHDDDEEEEEGKDSARVGATPESDPAEILQQR
eukprot:COSAG02_NODE_829_length_16689_cov_16.659433_2_plen_70_part_00